MKIEGLTILHITKEMVVVLYPIFEAHFTTIQQERTCQILRKL